MLQIDSFSGEERKVLLSVVETVVKTSDPEKIILFGSRAAGTAKEDSDYDILILKKYVKKRRKWAQKIYFHLKGDASVNIIVNTHTNFYRDKSKSCLVYASIHRGGKVIYEKR